MSALKGFNLLDTSQKIRLSTTFIEQFLTEKKKISLFCPRKSFKIFLCVNQECWFSYPGSFQQRRDDDDDERKKARILLVAFFEPPVVLPQRSRTDS